MKSGKFLQALEIIIVVMILGLVILAVVASTTGTENKTDSTEIQTEAELSQTETTEQENTAVETVPETTEWIAKIEYDDYAASEISPENFNKTIVLGNSQAQALANYGLLKQADFSTRVGLAINKVLVADKEQPAPIDKLKGKSYEKAVFIFGENELGWPYPESFVKEYKNVIAKVREMNPGIRIYVQGIFPVSKEYSEKSKSGITNENVKLFNEKLAEMCKEIDATFMPPSDAFVDENGAQPAGVSVDGVHFNYDYCKIWAGDLSAYLED